MDSKNLMIGDWVLLKSNGVVPDTNVQVSGIDEDGLSVRDCDNFIGYDEVKAIPITEEILKANGIDYESEVGIIKKIDGHIHIHGWMANCELYLGMIRYVHELQHALRLCGLTELADNFKLE